MWFLSSGTKVKTAVNMAVCKCIKSKKYRNMFFMIIMASHPFGPAGNFPHLYTTQTADFLGE